MISSPVSYRLRHVPDKAPPAPVDESAHLYIPVLQEALPHGTFAGIALPTEPEPVPASVLERLHPDEAAHAATLRGFRQIDFAGGRHARRVDKINALDP